MPDATEIIARILFGVLLLLSVFAARTILVSRPYRRPLKFDWAVLAVALVFISLQVTLPLLQLLLRRAEVASEPPPAPSLRIDEAIMTHFVIIAVLISAIAVRPDNRPDDYGISFRGWLTELRFGVLGFLASFPLVLAVIIVLGSFRKQETLNPLLILLNETGSAWTIVGVIFAAVVSAPLAEELLFRVALQGPLDARLPPAVSIAIPALVFAAVHGPYDALPLLPLALVLGILYHQRRSYVATVTTHALFNATFLILALWQRGKP